MRQHTRHTLYDAADTILVEAKQHNLVVQQPREWGCWMSSGHPFSTDRSGSGDRNPHQDVPSAQKTMKWGLCVT